MTPGGCPPDSDVAVSWTLGTLEPDEADRFGGHLQSCPLCCADVARLQQVADALAQAPGQVPPPPALRARLVALAENEAAMSQALDAVDARPRPRAGPRPALAVASVAVLLVAGVVALSLRPGDRPVRGTGQRTVVGTVTDDGGGPRARATVTIRGADAELVLTDLAGPPRGRVYQAWVVRPPAAPLPTGALFSVPRAGDTRVQLPDVRGAERIIVTAEPPRGGRVPSPPPRVIVVLRG
jgi:anti-sigma-K factor RskA